MVFESESAYVIELQGVLRIAHTLIEAVGISHQPSSSPMTNRHQIMVSSIDLPNPSSLLPSLLEEGLGHQLAASISEVYQLRAEELRQGIRGSIITAYHELAELPVIASASTLDVSMKKLVSTLRESYLYRLEQWKKEIIQRIKQAPRMPTDAALKNSRNFNQEYVPLLERFFEENPFPTHADKVFLAKKSNMQYRQIHVWFQNRRNRSKREGKTLRKKTTCEGPMKSLDQLQDYMCHTDYNSRAPKSSIVNSAWKTTDVGVARNDIPKDRLVSSSPDHAFPSPYPPTCNYDPFPCKTGLGRFDKPEWRRIPYEKLPVPVSISIDDLVEGFSRLNVRDETRSRVSPKLHSHAATAAITVIPSRAPHPSLVVRQYIPSANLAPLHPLVRAPVTRSKVFQSPSPTSGPVTLVPLSVSFDKRQSPWKRKTIPLPRRFPNRMQDTNQRTAPSEGSSASSSPRLFSTDFESRSCSISSVDSLPTPSKFTSLVRITV